MSCKVQGNGPLNAHKKRTIWRLLEMTAGKHHFCARFTLLKIMPMRLFFPLLLLAGLAGCQTKVDSCPKELEKREHALTNSLDSLLFHRDETPEDSFRIGLEVLRTWELQLFDAVRQCNFEQDLTRSYYWSKGRLKFPGRIQQEMEKLNRVPQSGPLR